MDECFRSYFNSTLLYYTIQNNAMFTFHAMVSGEYNYLTGYVYQSSNWLISSRQKHWLAIWIQRKSLWSEFQRKQIKEHSIFNDYNFNWSLISGLLSTTSPLTDNKLFSFTSRYLGTQGRPFWFRFHFWPASLICAWKQTFVYQSSTSEDVLDQ